MPSIDYLIQTAREIGEVHRKYHRRVAKRQKSVPQGHNADICDVDEITDSIIRSKFNKKRYSVNICSEESGFIDNHSGYTLYADSLDGTSFYLMGKKYSCVSLGLAKGSELIMGIIYNALTDQLYAAEKGSGAYMLDHGTYKTLRSKNTKEISEVALAMPSLKALTKDDAALSRFRSMVQDSWRFDCEGSIALNLCDVADGIFDIVVYPKIGGPWDIAAGIIITDEAGGYCADWRGNKIKADLNVPLIAASNRGICQKFIKKYFGGGNDAGL